MTTAYDILQLVQRDSPHALESLSRQWECRDPRLWQQHEDLYLECGRMAMALGQPILAFEIFKEGRLYFPTHTRLAYFAALALARIGSTGHASLIVEELLTALDRQEPLYVDVLSLAGRIAKDRWVKTLPGERRQELGRLSASYYQRAYEFSKGDYYPGINAATMSMLSGQAKIGQQIAREVYRTCQKLQSSAPRADYWLMATLGEACLLLNNQRQALRWYREARQLAGKNVGDVASIRRQVRLLAEVLDVDRAVIESLSIGRVAVFSGHMIDAPGRAIPRFPPALEPAVRVAIADALARLEVGFGYSSAACGADLLFLECLFEHGAQAQVVLPFRHEDFLQTSVVFAGATWAERFHQALAQATSVHCSLREVYLGDDALFDYNNRLMVGMALLHAERLGTEAVALMVLDSTSTGQVGGTATAFTVWQQTRGTCEVIPLDVLRRQHAGEEAHASALPQTRPAAPGAAPSVPPDRRHQRQVKTMLFADMVGFSKLKDESEPSFVSYFLGEVARVLHGMPIKPAFKNTWGDGLFLVFDDVITGADFALCLRDGIQQTDWTVVGLPEDTNIRMGLHAGPVFPDLDPILERQNFFGSHVNMAARIEPVVPPGAVYVSEPFAALLVASGAPGFACDYVGNIALAKGFGLYPMYRLRRSHEIE